MFAIPVTSPTHGRKALDALLMLGNVTLSSSSSSFQRRPNQPAPSFRVVNTLGGKHNENQLMSEVCLSILPASTARIQFCEVCTNNVQKFETSNSWHMFTMHFFALDILVTRRLVQPLKDIQKSILSTGCGRFPLTIEEGIM